MPIYEFRCNCCKDEFETLVRNTETDERIECPKCESTELERILSVCSRGAGQNQHGNSGCRSQSSGFS
jgi:putative FmdB family regulatory protein